MVPNSLTTTNVFDSEVSLENRNSTQSTAGFGNEGEWTPATTLSPMGVESLADGGSSGGSGVET